MNIVKFGWNLENLTLDDFGLDPEFNMLSAPACRCGCGEKVRICLEDIDDVLNFCCGMLSEMDCEWCAIFAIDQDNKMISVIKDGDEFDCIGSKTPVDDYGVIGELFDDMKLHMYGLIVSVGDGLYKVVEE